MLVEEIGGLLCHRLIEPFAEMNLLSEADKGLFNDEKWKKSFIDTYTLLEEHKNRSHLITDEFFEKYNDLAKCLKVKKGTLAHKSFKIKHT